MTLHMPWVKKHNLFRYKNAVVYSDKSTVIMHICIFMNFIVAVWWNVKAAQRDGLLLFRNWIFWFEFSTVFCHNTRVNGLLTGVSSSHSANIKAATYDMPTSYILHHAPRVKSRVVHNY
jgi:hypothetical protein